MTEVTTVTTCLQRTVEINGKGMGGKRITETNVLLKPNMTVNSPTTTMSLHVTTLNL